MRPLLSLTVFVLMAVTSHGCTASPGHGEAAPEAKVVDHGAVTRLLSQDPVVRVTIGSPLRPDSETGIALQSHSCWYPASLSSWLMRGIEPVGIETIRVVPVHLESPGATSSWFLSLVPSEGLFFFGDQSPCSSGVRSGNLARGQGPFPLGQLVVTLLRWAHAQGAFVASDAVSWLVHQLQRGAEALALVTYSDGRDNGEKAHPTGWTEGDREHVLMNMPKKNGFTGATDWAACDSLFRLTGFGPVSPEYRDFANAACSYLIESSDDGWDDFGQLRRFRTVAAIAKKKGVHFAGGLIGSEGLFGVTVRRGAVPLGVTDTVSDGGMLLKIATDDTKVRALHRQHKLLDWLKNKDRKTVHFGPVVEVEVSAVPVGSMITHELRKPDHCSGCEVKRLFYDDKDLPCYESTGDPDEDYSKIIREHYERTGSNVNPDIAGSDNWFFQLFDDDTGARFSCEDMTSKIKGTLVGTNPPGYSDRTEGLLKRRLVWLDP